MQYHVVLDCVITALDCTPKPNISYYFIVLLFIFILLCYWYVCFHRQILFIVLFAIFVDYDYGADGKHDYSLHKAPPDVGHVQLNNNFMASE